MPERVERAGANQRLDGALVQRLRVDAVTEVVEVRERAAFLARRNEMDDDALTDVADRG